jgi:hypothetical protein
MAAELASPDPKLVPEEHAIPAEKQGDASTLQAAT